MSNTSKRAIDISACQLDSEIFICCKCKCEFHHTEGTWLPIGEEKKQMMTERNGTLTIYGLSDFLRKPEIITSDEFTCYGCL